MATIETPEDTVFQWWMSSNRGWISRTNRDELAQLIRADRAQIRAALLEEAEQCADDPLLGVSTARCALEGKRLALRAFAARLGAK